MANDAAPAKTDFLGEHDSESLPSDAESRRRDVDCFGPAMGRGLPSTLHTYHSRVTAVFVHPSFFDDGEGNF